MINATEFGKIRRRLMKELAPEFAQNKSVYVKETLQAQIHSIRYTPFGRNSEYYIDVGVHFPYLPSFLVYGYNNKAIHPEPETSALNGRWHTIHGSTYPYGDTTESATIDLEKNITSCLEVLHAFGDKWGNGEPMLDVLTPAKMCQDAEAFHRLLNADSGKEQSRIAATMTSRNEIPVFKPLIGQLCVMLAMIAKHYGHPNLVAEYMKILEMPSIDRFFREKHQAIFMPYLN